MPGLRSLNLATKSEIAAATDEPLPCVTMRIAGVDRLLHLHQAFLRIELVVVRPTISSFLPSDAALGVDLVGQELESLEPDLADAGARRPTADRCRRF